MISYNEKQTFVNEKQTFDKLERGSKCDIFIFYLQNLSSWERYTVLTKRQRSIKGFKGLDRFGRFRSCLQGRQF